MQLKNKNVDENDGEARSSTDRFSDVTNSTAEFSDHSESFNKLRSKSASLFKHVLSKKIFVGNYTERRFVKSLTSYRDIVVIEEDEKEFIEGLKKMQEISNKNYQHKWLGITTEETDGKYCLWVELNDMPLGKYWFKVTSVTIASQEIILKLAQIRPYETKTKAQNCDTSSIEFNEVFNATTAWELLKFSVVLIATIITFIVNALPYIGDFILRLVKELNTTIRNLTPFFLAFMEFMSRCIGGFYWMIIMLFKNQNPAQRPYNPYPLAIKGRRNLY